MYRLGEYWNMLLGTLQSETRFSMLLQENEAERTERFFDYVKNGGKVEATDWMPDVYRQSLIRFIEMHANSELMGILPERDWIMRAPTIQRKLALTAKIQDEAGHAELLYRLVEDLGKPRSACIEDLIAGKGKFHNAFHYRTKSWADTGIIAWLVDAAAIVSQHALRDSSYAPYARTMQKILLGRIVPHDVWSRCRYYDDEWYRSTTRDGARGTQSLVAGADGLPWTQHSR